jgi:vacuolar-type H+-ATPase subunit B/Vma2
VDRLIAIMLGRMEMTVDESIRRFREYSAEIFRSPRLSGRIFSGLLRPRYRPENIVRATKLIVGDFDPTLPEDKWKRNSFAAPNAKCKR